MKKNPFSLISARDGFCGIVEPKTSSVRIVAPKAFVGQQYTVAAFLRKFPDSIISPAKTETEVQTQLQKEEAALAAFDFTIAFFNERLKAETRRSLLPALEKLFGEKTIVNSVLDVILAKHLKISSTLDLSIADTFPRAGKILRTIVESQDRVAFLEASLELTEAEFGPFTKEEKHQCLSSGLFRILVIEGRSSLDRKKLTLKLLFESGFKEYLGVHRLNKLIAEYFEQLPEDPKRATTTSNGDLTGLEDFARKTVRVVDTKPIRAEIGLHRAVSQVESASDHFRIGADSRGHDIISHLIAQQSESQQGHKYAVKSLCNLAKRCRQFGRSDVALKYLKTAFQLSAGVDSILFLQMATMFRELGRTEEAFQCLNNARNLSEGGRNEQIESELIRLKIVTGDYSGAITALSQRPNIDYDPVDLVELGNVYRRTNSIRSARECFLRSLKLMQVSPSTRERVDTDDECALSALAGLAECNKQTGKLDKAIVKYTRVLKYEQLLNFNTQQKVFNLAVSWLYRAVGDYSASISHLEALKDLYPVDTQVNFQLAKSYMASGHRQLAIEYFQKAKPVYLDDLAEELFLIAIGNFRKSDVVSTRAAVPSQINSEVNLSRFGAVVRSLEAEEFREGLELASSLSNPSKFHNDFSYLLQFHACIGMGTKLEYSLWQRVRTIAKRGYKLMRFAAQSIEAKDLSSALELERQVCLSL